MTSGHVLRVVYRFALYELDTHAGELRKHGTRIKVQSKPLALLLVLLEHSGEVVTREELRARLWTADTFVDFEHSLSVAVRKLRDALCDSAEQPRYIETVPRRGYRFLMEVACVAGPGKKMLAVLPFGTLEGTQEGDPAQRQFADGLTDEMITQLGRVNPRSLGVIARSSAMTYRGTTKSAAEIARELGVEYLLEGSVQRQGRRLRIRTQLVQAGDQTQLWGETYDRPTADLLGIQTEVAQELARALAVELLPGTAAAIARGGTQNSQARASYLKGRFEWSRRTVHAVARALEYFHAAVALDPHFALALNGLADAYSLLGYYGVLAPAEAFGKARAACLAALAIEPKLAEAHCSLAFATLQYDWDWANAEREHRLALELNENYAPAHHWYGIDLTQAGRFTEAEAALTRAVQLDPMDVATRAHIGRLRYFERDYKEAVRLLRHVVEGDPAYGPAHYFLGLAHAQLAEHGAALDGLRSALLLSPDHPAVLSAMAFVYARMGRPFHALELRDRLSALAAQQYVSPLFIAFAAATTDRDEAFRQLEHAVEERAPWLLYLPMEPAFDALREDVRFAAVVRKLKPKPKAKAKSRVARVGK